MSPTAQPHTVPPGRVGPRACSAAPHGIGGRLSPSFYFFTRAGVPLSHRFYGTNRPAQGFRCTGRAGTVRARMKAMAGPVCVEPAPARLPDVGGNFRGAGGNGWRSITDRSFLDRAVAHLLRGLTRGCARLLSVTRAPWGVEPEGSDSRPSGLRRRPPLPGFVRVCGLAEFPFFIEPYGDSPTLIAGVSAAGDRTRGFRALKCGES